MLTETACVPGRNLVARNFMEVDYYWIFACLTKNATSADAKVIGSLHYKERDSPFYFWA